MTFSKLGTDGQLIEELDQQTGKKKFVFTPTIDATGKEQIVQLPQISRKQGTYIIGATGTGKSGLITNLVLQDIKQGKGVAVLDPHTDLTNSILARLPADREKDVILLDALDKTHVFGLNLYQCDNPTDDELIQETYERVAHIFDMLWLEENEVRFGPRVMQGLRNSTYTLIGNSSIYGCGMLEIPMLFEEDVPRAHMLAKLPQTIRQIVEKYWKRHEGFDKGEKADRADMVANKVEDYIDSPIFRRIVGQGRTTIHVPDIMDEGKILLVKLPGKFEEMTELLGAMIIAQLLAASYAREKQQKRRQFNIYADEFQRFATRDFAKLLTEASRKYNTPVTIAHQARDFIDLKNKAASIQVGNLVVLRISDKDAKELAENFYLDPEEGEPIEKSIRTPVLEPIQYMVNHGIHPLEHTRTFIETYGKQLVELAKKEEESERVRLSEERRYDHDLLANVRYLAPPVAPPVSHKCRNLLMVFNGWFYRAMMAGKQGETVGAFGISTQVIDDMVRVFHIHGGYHYFQLQKLYHSYIAASPVDYSIFPDYYSPPPTDYDARIKELQQKLADLSHHVQDEVNEKQAQLNAAVEQLRQGLRSVLIEEANQARARMLIIWNGQYRKYANVHPMDEKRFDDIKHSRPDINTPPLLTSGIIEQKGIFGKTTWKTDDFGDITLPFSTWEEAVRYYLEKYQDRWFRVNNKSLFNQGNRI